MKLKKGDKVKVTSGKDQGKEAKIEKIFPKENSLILAGINVFKKHMKAQGEGRPGGIIEVNKPLPVSKVALVCPKCSEVTRVGYKFINEKKVRVCAKCDQEI